MATDQDSLAYVVGLNVGKALIKMDSTLNADVVCMAIRDVFNGTEKMTIDEARDYFLAQKTYFVHEKAKRCQERFLEDLSKSDRAYVRLKNGVTYKIVKLGDQSIQSLVSRDTLRIAMTIKDERGEILHAADTIYKAYRDIIPGLQDVIRITGKGGVVEAWIPSAEAYGTGGDSLLGVKPNQLVRFDVDIVDIKYHNHKFRK
jgi:FKBP-type peptidyl-prolyl cis-trans isomerase